MTVPMKDFHNRSVNAESLSDSIPEQPHDNAKSGKISTLINFKTLSIFLVFEIIVYLALFGGIDWASKKPLAEPQRPAEELHLYFW